MLYPSSTQRTPMDTTDWLKAIVQEGEASTAMMMDASPSSTPPPSVEFLRQQSVPPPPPPPPPMMERRLRPPHDQLLKCPRCDSTHTKFCYYNNYSLSQPRYFCKTCRRYWTKGGSLRNVPVGGGCRKNRRSSGGAAAAKKAAERPVSLGQFLPPNVGVGGSTDLHLSTLAGLLPPLSQLNAGGGSHRGFVDCKFSFHPSDTGDSKFGGAVLTDPRGQFLLGLDGGNLGGGGNGYHAGFGELGHGGGLGGGVVGASTTTAAATFGGLSQLPFSPDIGSHGAMVENCQRLALPWTGNVDEDGIGAMESKLDPKLLSLEWQEQCGEVARDPFGYSAVGGNAAGLLWGGVAANNHHHGGSSATTNPLV